MRARIRRWVKGKVNNIIESTSAFNVVRDSQLEIEWANIYHDSIKDKNWLTDLSISPGRWAVNYSFLYILVRVMNDCKPQRVIELGLGESTKIVSEFIKHQLPNTDHIICEHDLAWTKNFTSRYSLSANSIIQYLALRQDIIEGFPVNCYSDLSVISGAFNLYIVDGPFGSPRFSRYDLVRLVKSLTSINDFVIIIDDYNRSGEAEMADLVLKTFKTRGIQVFTGYYRGSKSQLVIASYLYRHCASL